MSLDTIRKKLKIFKEEIEEFTFAEPELTDLIAAIAEHILASSPPEEKKEPDVDFITLKQFEDKYGFVSTNTLARICQRENENRVNEMHFYKNKWWIDEKKMLEYLKKSPIFKKRLERMGKN